MAPQQHEQQPDNQAGGGIASSGFLEFLVVLVAISLFLLCTSSRDKVLGIRVPGGALLPRPVRHHQDQLKAAGRDAGLPGQGDLPRGGHRAATR